MFHATNAQAFAVPLAIFCLIVTPWFIYLWIKLYHYHNHLFMQKRSISFTAALSIAFYLLAAFDVFLSPEHSLVTQTNRWSTIIYYICGQTGTSSILLTVLFRTWFLCYNLNYNNAIRSSKWWNILSKNTCNKSFWISKKHSFGSVGYIFPFFLIWGIVFNIIACAFLFLPSLFYFRMYLLMFALHTILVISLTVIIWTQLPPKMFDMFYIRLEIKYFLIYWAFSAAFHGTLRMIDFESILGNLESRYAISWQISAVTTCLGMIYLNYNTILYPISIANSKSKNKVNSKQTERKDTNKLELDVQIGATLNNTGIKYRSWVEYIYYHPSKSSGKDSNNKQVLSPHVHEKQSIANNVNKIGTNTNFDLFANYLVGEFAFENLAFIYEVNQFKHQLLKLFKLLNYDSILNQIKEKSNGMHVFFCQMQFSNALLKCDIIFNKENKNSPFKQAFLLFEKYVRNNEAPFEINISYHTRKDMHEYFENEIITNYTSINININHNVVVKNVNKHINIDDEEVYTDTEIQTDNHHDQISSSEWLSLFCVFDDAMIEVNEILTGCFVRFTDIRT